METRVQNSLHPGLLVSPWANRRPWKHRCIGYVPQLGSEIRFGVHANSLNNVTRAINERVMYVKGPGGTLVDPPIPESGIFDDTYYLDLLLGETRRCPKVSRQAIVDSYKGGKRTLYQKAAESMSVPISRKDSYVKAFVKAEKINLTAKGDPAPRIIQPFSVRYNLELGRYLKFSEKRIMSAIDRVWGRPTILSGYNCDEQGEKIAAIWKQFRNPVAVGLDASRWDRHVSRQALVYEMSFYKRLFPGDSYLSYLVDMQLDNRGIAIARDGCVRYSMPGRRMSGVPNTPKLS